MIGNWEFEDVKWKDARTLEGKIRHKRTREHVGRFVIVLETANARMSAGLFNEGIFKTGRDGLEKEKKMARQLFHVFVVDPEDEQVLEKLVISKSSEGAKFKALKRCEEEMAKDVDDLDVIVHPVGHIRNKKEIQEVRVVKD